MTYSSATLSAHRSMNSLVGVYEDLPTLISAGQVVVLRKDVLTCRILQRDVPCLVAEAHLFSSGDFRLLELLLQFCRTKNLYCPYEQLVMLLPSARYESDTKRIQQEIQRARSEKQSRRVLQPLYSLRHSLEASIAQSLGWNIIIHLFQGLSLEKLCERSVDSSSYIHHYSLTTSDSFEQHVYSFHQSYRTLSLLAVNQILVPSFPEIRVSSSEVHVLRLLFESFPHYVPFEHLQSNSDTIQNDDSQQQHQLPQLVSSLRRKLKAFPLIITCDRGLGYTLHVIKSSEDKGS